MALSADGRWLYSSSKDGSLIKWDLNSITNSTSTHPLRAVYHGKAIKPKAKAKDKRLRKSDYPGHQGEILTLSLSEDGCYLCTGGTDRLLGVWKTEGSECRWLGGLRGHKDTIAVSNARHLFHSLCDSLVLQSVSFRKDSHQVFTSSYDRTVKIFDAAALSYIETLFGHQDRICAIDCLKTEAAVTAGGRDKTLRYWKIADESQLVFRAGLTSRLRQVLEGGKAFDEEPTEPTVLERKFVEGSTDCVAMIDDSHFISGGDSG